jgi:putative glutamine amidotransferase
MKGTWRGNAIHADYHRAPDAGTTPGRAVLSETVRPLIGISSYARGGPRPSFSVPCEYVDAIRRAGGVPIVLPPMLGPVTEALDAVSALILPGGGDIHPDHYGGDDHDTTYGVCHERDNFELHLARAALERDLPLVCVCRGMQLLNVALGGDLIPHIPDRFGMQIVHRTPDVKATPHPVDIASESHLARVYGAGSVTVQSVHHQAVGRLGDGLRPVAWAPDGVIEALESERHAFVVAVQWHPELDETGDGHPRTLFDELVARVAR